MSPPTISVLVADDHPVWRSGIRHFLGGEPDLTVVAEAANGREALQLTRAKRPDVLLLDMEMPQMTGVEVARVVRSEGLPSKILALSSYDDEAYVTGLLKAGASGYITKDKSIPMIVEAVRAVARGEGRWFVQPTLQADQGPDLSEREREVLALLADGKSNGEIAEALAISENTVRNHLGKAYGKIGVGTAREAMAWAWRLGFARGS